MNEITKLLRLSEVMRRVPLAKPSIYRLIAAEKFPKPIKCGGRASFWLESAIEGWINSHVNAGASPAAGER